MRKKGMILLAVLLVLAWYQTIKGIAGVPAQYEAHMQAAETYAQKEIYETAIEEYKAALALRPDEDQPKLGIAQMQLKLGKKSAFIAGCEELIEKEPVNEEALAVLADYYASDGKTEKLVTLLKELREEKTNETVETLWKQYRGSYEKLYYSYEQIMPFYNGYAVIGNADGYGMIEEGGEVVLAPCYAGIGGYAKEADCVPVKAEDGWYYVNEEGYKQIVPDENYEYLGTLSEGYAVAGCDGKYTYVNEQMELQTDDRWDAASNFCDGRAAVLRDGAWALIDKKMKLQTDYIYEDVVMDAWGFCSREGRIFVKQADVYRLIDKDGAYITEEIYEDANAFDEEGMAAVCKNGKWGYIDSEGTWIIECQYEEAGAFAQGIAPVRKDGKWGYIDRNGEVVIEPVFEECYPFNEAGIAPVKEEGWYLIRLYALS